ncbi:MAG TPA: GDCCVxC domain-containing (seleno)protein [Stellaceae bacterium]|nr:GDCCVxC domain-containing (seleno)protein [Stellaceae bacterium]
MESAGLIVESILTCPICGTTRRETMPTDACVVVYQCTACGAWLRPKTGTCCVFCSYGSVRCPPVQAAGTT